MAPTKSFERRYAKRETKQRTFTFVRNWKNVAPESQQNIQETNGTQLNERAIISPVPQIFSDSDNLSTSDIVNQSPVPIIISHVANQSQHLQNDEDDEEDEDDDDDVNNNVENGDDAHKDDVVSPKKPQVPNSFKSPKSVRSQTRQQKTKSATDMSLTHSSLRDDVGSPEKPQEPDSFKSPKSVRSQTRQQKTKSATDLSLTRSPLRENVTIQKQTKRSTKEQTPNPDGNVHITTKRAESDGSVSLTTSRNSSVVLKGKSVSASLSNKEPRKVSVGRTHCDNHNDVIASTPSSLWKARRVTGCSKKHITQPTSSGISTKKNNSLVMVTSTPMEPVKKTTVTRAMGHQNRQQSTDGAKVRRNEPLQDDEDSVRCGTDVLDLDIIYECTEETEQEVLEEAISQTCVNAAKKVLDVTRKELRKTMSQIHQIKLQKAQVQKKKSNVKRLRADLREIQQTKTRLKSKVTNLRKRCHVDKDLLLISNWLCDFSKFQKQWFNSPASKERQIIEAVQAV
ncbi:DNA ligase 1-like isoform X2 [Gigantopelta aegis]|uniref:DNA ligase 1-like isoform X2 n=1 Tax=Gigantopelta aegis TaxID=1735272 RepID=UPI001B88BED1|nr:DNA ligase 1-like isoform X2 [Gigantopelta aegis]